MKLFSLLCVAFFAFIATPALAETKIGIIDTRRVLEDSDAGKNLAAQLKTRQEAVQSEATAFEKKLKAEEQDILAKRKDMKPEEFETRKKKFEQDILSSRQTVITKSSDLDSKRKAALATLQTNLAKAATEVAKSQQLDMILDRQLVIVAQEELDVTADVMKKLNEMLKTIALDSGKK